MLTKSRYIKSPSVQMLERLELEAYRREHPTIPESAVVPTKHRDDTANGLTRCIIRYLQLKGHQAERINTMGRPIDTRRTYDVAGCLRQVGSLRWGKSTSTAGSAVENAGGLYVVARNFEDFVGWYGIHFGDHGKEVRDV